MLANEEALLASLIEIERWVGNFGWDQPARLFALVPTAQLIAEQPQLADQLVVTSPDALSSIEQEEFNPTGADLMIALSQLAWPQTVSGCALVTERSFLPASVEAEIPAEPMQAAEFVANHPQRQDLRVVAGALRVNQASPIVHCVARVASEPAELITGADLVPALTGALALTLTDTEPESN